ncbi:Ceramide-1-phosphate transfer protein isoform 4 [Schistosoma japonicum]|uniref:Ceramide-1-phosphate transfer protein isoform 4 n=1 Tax=Schistosoma japonicum TaxID=6182 RepID=A0A4Z2D7I8_SCHJA|nr:Ceramide-1-phosphate transfer protein isoform 4 [Schistosoma japonicum]
MAIVFYFLNIVKHIRKFRSKLEFSHVSRLLMYFGNLFYFVTSDVSHKISELRALYAADTVNYKSVEQMVFYEEKQNEHLPVKKWRCTGCRTLLRLHRALLFVIDLMLEVCRVLCTFLW